MFREKVTRSCISNLLCQSLRKQLLYLNELNRMLLKSISLLKAFQDCIQNVGHGTICEEANFFKGPNARIFFSSFISGVQGFNHSIAGAPAGEQDAPAGKAPFPALHGYTTSNSENAPPHSLRLRFLPFASLPTSSIYPSTSQPSPTSSITP